MRSGSCDSSVSISILRPNRLEAQLDAPALSKLNRKTMSTVAVTGATGFIGSAVVRKLVERGRHVRALVEPGAPTKNLDNFGGKVERVTVDVCDGAAMERALSGCKTLFHLAAIYRTWLPNPDVIYRVNLEGTTATLLAAQKANVERIVYTSSIAAIGLRDDGRPSDETVEFNIWDIANDYILTKYLSERIAMNFARSGMPIVVVNPGFPFGPGDVAPTPTGKIILSVLKGQVPGMGPGGFSAIDVDDVAEGHLAAEERGGIGERYILANHNVTLKELFELVSSIAGVKVPTLPIPRALSLAVAFGMEMWADHVSHEEPPATYKALRYAQRNVFFDNTKARTELGLPETPLADSIERSIKWFRDNGMV